MKTGTHGFDLLAHLDRAIMGALTTAPTTAKATPSELIHSTIAIAMSMATSFGLAHLLILASFLPEAEPDEEKAIAEIRSVYASRRAIDTRETN